VTLHGLEWAAAGPEQQVAVFCVDTEEAAQRDAEPGDHSLQHILPLTTLRSAA
jgi:hypothetical protein